MHMRYVIFTFIFIFSGFSQSWAGNSNVQAELTNSHDLVAIVKIESINTEYSEAVNIVVEKVIYRYGEVTDSIIPVDIEAGDQLILVGYDIFPILKNHKGAITKEVQSISSTSCYGFRDYKVGKRLRLFAKEIRKGFYKNSACTLTRAIDEST